MIKRLGILGTGHLAAFVCQGLRAGGWPGEILVSPHNCRSASLFVERFDANIAKTNQQLLHESEMVLVAVRPQHCEAALRDLDWPNDTVMLSVMAGIRIEEIKALVGNKTIVRAMPVSAAEIGNSPTTIFPNHADVNALMSLVGTTISMEDELAFEMATVNAAVYGWHFALIDELVNANVDAGLSEQQAREIVTSTLSAAASVAANSELPRGTLLTSLSTPGGITAEGLAELNDQDALSSWTDAFNRVADRLRRTK